MPEYTGEFDDEFLVELKAMEPPSPPQKSVPLLKASYFTHGGSLAGKTT